MMPVRTLRLSRIRVSRGRFSRSSVLRYTTLQKWHTGRPVFLVAGLITLMFVNKLCTFGGNGHRMGMFYVM